MCQRQDDGLGEIKHLVRVHERILHLFFFVLNLLGVPRWKNNDVRRVDVFLFLLRVFSGVLLQKKHILVLVLYVSSLCRRDLPAFRVVVHQPLLL